MTGPIKRKKQKITSPYGKRGGIFHRGVDLRSVNFLTRRKQAVIATEDSMVLRVKRDSNDNGIIVLAPLESDYDEIKYIHVAIEKSPVLKGQKVYEGDFLGYTERRGQSTSHHLHFEVWKNSDPVNPLQYFNRVGIDYV